MMTTCSLLFITTHVYHHVSRVYFDSFWLYRTFLNLVVKNLQKCVFLRSKIEKFRRTKKPPSTVGSRCLIPLDPTVDGGSFLLPFPPKKYFPGPIPTSHSPSVSTWPLMVLDPPNFFQQFAHCRYIFFWQKSGHLQASESGNCWEKSFAAKLFIVNFTLFL